KQGLKDPRALGFAIDVVNQYGIGKSPHYHAGGAIYHGDLSLSECYEMTDKKYKTRRIGTYNYFKNVDFTKEPPLRFDLGKNVIDINPPDHNKDKPIDN